MAKKKSPPKRPAVDWAAIMNACDAKFQTAGFRELTATERVVHLISYFNFEVELGGVTTYFDNTAGEHARETVQALQAIGATTTASTLAALNSLLWPKGQPRSRSKRFDRLQDLTEADTDAFRAVEAAFSAESPDIFSRLCSYIESHLAELHDHLPSKKAAASRKKSRKRNN